MCNPNAYPTDDYARTKGEIDTLNRIDQEWECDEILKRSWWGVPEYCMAPEWHPFTNRCSFHTPVEYPYTKGM